MTTHQYFKRHCRKCEKEFRPTGKFQKVCLKCNSHPDAKERLMKKYFQSKEQLDIIRSNETLSKWKILSAAYKLGKRIWGSRFTRQTLAQDMDLPYTTTLRCLSLDKANKKAWRLIRANKISAFKVAMILQSKSTTFQDEIIDLVIKENLSTCQIKSLKINNIKDINIEKLRLATEKGFARQSTAARSFETWIERGKLLLLMRKSALTEEMYNKIKEELIMLNKKIERYVE